MSGPIITIYCDGPDDARHEREVITQYQQYRVGIELAWFPLERWNYRGKTGRTRLTQQYVMNDKPQADLPDVHDDGFRVRFQLPECSQCRFK